MLLTSLIIDNFKNIKRARLGFSPRVNGFLGLNGMGKSNLLDAIYALSFTKSFCGVTDRMLISRGEDFAMVKGTYRRRGLTEELTLGLGGGKRKSLKRKGKEYQRMAEHIGAFPLVMISPADEELIRESAEERRRWMDMVISQSDARYLDALIRYGKALEQRNRLLREGSVDHNLYDAIEAAMEPAATYLHEARAHWTERLQPLVVSYYSRISQEEELPHLIYSSQMNESHRLSDLLESARRHDEIVRHTSAGPHRDDIEIMLNGMPMRRTGSQGQCKSLVIALRMAQYEFLRESTGMKPLLLLDDIFDKLDARRVERIMSIVSDTSFGQIFITDTNRSHLDEIMNHTAGDYSLWEVSHGEFAPLHSNEAH